MAKIALRVYNNEINDLIDHGQIEEAISHCRHILETFPKHVDTYRLLGKAYLEEQRYGDASDILQRVLSSIPEDFISQVGMSIIREDEGNLDSAIFHMERAFEVQPSNHAIQDELKRLQGKRDGVEPAKIRLTRGALARMYAHGNLHDLAIAELLAALSEDPQRYDLMVLLANMYFQADKKAEAAETCSTILEKLPYCLAANHLMVNILETSDREDNAQMYKGRWVELDPYAGTLEKGSFDTEFVPNQTVTVDKLDWEPGDYGDPGLGQPAWASSLGANLQDDSQVEDVPEWMQEEDGDETSDDDITLKFGAPPDGEDSEMPAWMPSSEESPDQLESELPADEETPEIVSSDPVESHEENLFPVEGEEETAPEWMSIPVDDSVDAAPETIDSSEEQPEDMGVEGEISEEVESAETEDEAIPDFMKDAGWEAGSGDEGQPEQTFDDSLSEDDVEIEKGEIPDWMKNMAPDGEAAEEPEIQDEEASITEDTPDIPSEEPITDEEDEPTETPAWLSQLGSQQDEATPEEVEPMSTSDEFESKDDQAADESADSQESEEQEGLAWLENLAAKQGIPEEELVTDPEERTETPPEWSQSPAGNAATDEPPTKPPDEKSMDWLQQLSQESTDAAAADAPSDEVSSEEMPAFFQADDVEQAAEGENVAAFSELPDELSDGEADDEPSMDWLDQLSQEAAEEAAPSPAAEETSDAEQDDWLASLSTPEEAINEPVETPAEEAPVSSEAEEEDWLANLSEQGEVEAEQVEAPAESAAEDDGLGWLENLAAKQGIAEEELVTSPEDRTEIPPEWTPDGEDDSGTADASDEPSMEWLDQLSQEAAEEAQPDPETPETPDSEQDDWLAGLSTPEVPATDSGDVPSESVEEDEGLGWLENLAAKQGIDEEELVTSPEDRSETPPDWLQTPDDESTETEPESEDAGEPSLEWLNQLGQDSVEEAAPAAMREEASEKETEDEDMGWLDDLSEQAAPPTSTESEAEDSSFGEPPQWILPDDEAPVEEAKDLSSTPSKDTSAMWLDELSQESTTEDAAEVEEEIDLSTDMLNDISALEQDLKQEEPGSTPDAIDQMNEWVDSLDKPDSPEVQPAEAGLEPDLPMPDPGADTIESAVEEKIFGEAEGEMTGDSVADDYPEVEPGAETIESVVKDEAIGDTDADIIEPAATGDYPEIDPGAETIVSDVVEEEPQADAEAASTMVPEWLQDVAEEKPEPDAIEQPPEWLPEIEEPSAESEAVAPTQASEWQPEAEVQPQTPVEEVPIPEPEESKPAPSETVSPLDEARQAMNENDMDKAISTYGKLVKRGKEVNEAIDDIEDALRKHPINPSLWQLFGDALMRADRLQEALDAYSKAEDLLR